MEWSELDGSAPSSSRTTPPFIGLPAAGGASGRAPWPSHASLISLALARLALPRLLVSVFCLQRSPVFRDLQPRLHRSLGTPTTWAEVLLGFIGRRLWVETRIWYEEPPSRRPSTPPFVAPTSPASTTSSTSGEAAHAVGRLSVPAQRVGSYYTRAEKRPKVQRMVSWPAGSVPSHLLGPGGIRELRDIATSSPFFNSRRR